MANAVLKQSTPPMATQVLLALSARLTIGNGVCITEGLIASIMALMPKSIMFYIVGALLTLITWLVFWRFRDNKLGADVGDLCFWDFASRSVLPLYFYQKNISPDFLWYIWAAISVLKIIRVYLWENSATQQHGWGKFGPMTLYYAKYHAPKKASTPWGRLAIEVGCALVVAIIAAVKIKGLDDFERVAVGWVVPVLFEFVYGPTQLRNLKLFGNMFAASLQRETAINAEVEQLKRENEQLKKENGLLRQMQQAPKKAHTTLIEAYEATRPDRQHQVVGVVLDMADVFPAVPKK